MQNLSPIGWALRPLKRYAEFSGRSSRAEFWWFMLFMMIVSMIMWIVLVGFIGFGAFLSASAAQGPRAPFAMFGALGAMGILMILFWLAVLLPLIAVQVRRLHDTNRSGWWLGGFYLLYVLYFVLMFSGLGVAAVNPAEAGNGATPTQPNMGIFGAIMALGLVMFIYEIVLLVFYCLPGTTGRNRFGDDPYGADVGEVFA